MSDAPKTVAEPQTNAEADDRHRVRLGEHEGQPPCPTDAVPPARFGIYRGISARFIVVPMIIESLTVSLFYRSLLEDDPRAMLSVVGALMLPGTVAMLRVDAARSMPDLHRRSAGDQAHAAGDCRVSPGNERVSCRNSRTVKRIAVGRSSRQRLARRRWR